MLQCQFKTETREVVGLVRVSTRQQGRSGLGLAAQEKAIRDFCDREGLNLVKVFTEIESGKATSRPVLDEAIQFAQKQSAFLCVAKLDRLSRKVSFISKLMEEETVPFISVELGTQVQPLILHIWASVAQAEAQKISERTKAALQAKIATGWKAGQSINQINHLGREKRTKKADAFALKLSSIIRGFQANGVDTLNGLAFNLNQSEIKTSRNNVWTAQQVKRLLARLDKLEAQNQ